MSEDKRINQTVVRLIIGDITDIEIDAFVYYAEHSLSVGTGFGTAISARGGPTIQAELDKLGPLETCETAISQAGNLKANAIIHAVGPRFQEQDIAEKLERTVKNVMRRAEDMKISRLALPAMGSGFYGIPVDVCADVMIDVINRHVSGKTTLEEVVLCVIDSREHTPFKAKLASLS